MTKIGKRVICVNDDFSNMPPLYKIIFTLPEAGKIYTIRHIREKANSYLLKEITNGYINVTPDGNFEPAFFSWRFKPLTKNKLKEKKEKYDLIDHRDLIPKEDIEELQMIPSQ